MATTPMPSSASYPGNSHNQKAKAESPDRPEVQKVVTSEVTERKKGFGRRFMESFTGDDARTVGQFILMDVLVPAFKNMLSDAVTQGVERSLFGSARPRSSVGYTSYNRIQPRAVDTPPWRTDVPGASTISSRARAVHDFREIVIADRVEANLVLDTLSQMIDQYGVATVADLYNAVGISSDYPDRQWGWDDLSTSRIERVRNGYLLVVPPPSNLR